MRPQNPNGDLGPGQSDDQVAGMFASLASMEGILDTAPPPLTPPLHVRLRRLYPGLAVAAAVAAMAHSLSAMYGTPVMLLALLIGMAFSFSFEDKRCSPGIEFASRTLLRFGVVLLGLRLTIDQFSSFGIGALALVPVAMGATILIGVLASRKLGLGAQFGVLSGGAVAICGASAALAIATVLPRTKHVERDALMVIALITPLSSGAMIFYPHIAVRLGLDPSAAGVFLGGSIHDVAQVVGAGYSLSPETGDAAAFIKLMRVALLAPIVIGISLLFRRRGAYDGAALPPLLPGFLIGFLALMCLRTTGVVPKLAVNAAMTVSQACLAMAIASLGMKNSFRSLHNIGWRQVTLLVSETACIAIIMLGGILLLRR